MSVNSISQDITALKIHPLPASNASAAKLTNVTSAVNEQSTVDQAGQSGQQSAGSVNASKSNLNSLNPLQKNEALSTDKPSTDALASAQKKPVRAMSHVLETYNQQGELLLKFMDSNNNLLYQIPSEMEARMKEQMKQQESSTNTTG